MTLREFSGWVPAERHLHFDADGNATGYTIVERESRIDDADRTELMALAQHDAAIGPCGYHPIIAKDEANTFTPETDICPVCAAIDKWNRMLDEQDKKISPDAPATEPRPSDGRHSYMRMLSPEQAAAARANASPELL
jgi:hypothetical protein